MTDIDRCLICGEAIPEGMQVCNNCMAQYHFEAEETVEIAEEMRDIAGVLSITANTDGNIKKSMESILRIADRLERKGNEEKRRTKVFAESRFSKAENGNHTGWHLYNWKPQDDETVMKAIYEAEQLHPYSCGRYKNDFEQFEKDWKAETYDPGATLAFEDAQVEVLEVVQEEVNNIDPQEVQKAVMRAQDVKRDRQRKRRMRASKGSRYQKRYL